MAEPKKRLTSTRSGARRSHLKAKKLILIICPKCKEQTLSHHACPTCGYYKGVNILKLEEKAEAKEERRKAAAAEEKSEAK